MTLFQSFMTLVTKQNLLIEEQTCQKKYYRVIALIAATIVPRLDIEGRELYRRILSRVGTSKDASMRASVDIQHKLASFDVQTRDNILR